MESKEILDWINLNKEWLFSGIGIVLFGLVWKIFNNNNEESKAPESFSSNGNESNNNENNININIDTAIKEKEDNYFVESSKYSKTDDLKNNIYILFIDDDTKFKVVNILKTAGYNNVKIIKDVKSLNLDDVKKADILFIDIQGVGKKMDFKDEGLGLASALMQKYGVTKKYVIYSSETNGDRFNHVLREADDFLSKDADPYQFESIIEKFFLEER